MLGRFSSKIRRHEQNTSEPKAEFFLARPAYHSAGDPVGWNWLFLTSTRHGTRGTRGGRPGQKNCPRPGITARSGRASSRALFSGRRRQLSGRTNSFRKRSDCDLCPWEKLQGRLSAEREWNLNLPSASRANTQPTTAGPRRPFRGPAIRLGGPAAARFDRHGSERRDRGLPKLSVERTSRAIWPIKGRNHRCHILRRAPRE